MNGYSVRILADSEAPNGKRLTTWELTYPRMVHAELMTHRVFSRNSASSRAIPNAKLRRAIKKCPVLPVFWGRNQAGMSADVELTGIRKALVKQAWLAARWCNLFFSWVMAALGAHKQLANRLVEPHMFITVILTATEFSNWFRLRNSPKAQPEIRWVAAEMQKQYEANAPARLGTGDWHLPMIEYRDWIDSGLLFGDDKEGQIEFLKHISVARCARVSYLTHTGKRDYNEDIRLHDDLAKAGHWSPFEHVAQAWPEGLLDWSGNFQGWFQYREEIDPNFINIGVAELPR